MGLNEYKGAKFSIIAHSVGSYVAYNALLQPDFPIKQLYNIFNLAGPLNDSPVKIIAGVDQLLEAIFSKLDYKNLKHVAHFNVSGGPRDLNVPADISSFAKAIARAKV